MSVHIASISSSLPAFLAQHAYAQVMVLVDEQSLRFCAPKIKPFLPPGSTWIKIKSGEEHKNLSTCEHIWAAMTKAQLDRHALLINLGGGVIGDMGGFCAATYKRGIDFIQIPTTLLAQVDASVGGKLGIDFMELKNHLGVFQLPAAVLVDPSFVNTLPERELRSGFAEIVKHCLIRDADQWNQLRGKEWHENDWSQCIPHSIAIKQAVVAADPKESGLRKILNFGHTLGHALESYLLQKNRKVLHGEAIAVGMITEAFISYKRGLISLSALEEIEAFLFATYGRVAFQAQEIPSIVKWCKQDKKNRGNEVLGSLLMGIGDCAYDVALSTSEIKKAFQYYLG